MLTEGSQKFGLNPGSRRDKNFGAGAYLQHGADSIFAFVGRRLSV
jgi:hypothetical protein